MAIKTVCLETAKKLKDFGFRQDKSHICFRKFWRISSYGSEPWYGFMSRENINELDIRYSIAAPTTEDLLEELPSNIHVYKTASGYSCSCFGQPCNTNPITLKRESAEECLAAMYIYLKQQGLIK